MSYPVQVYIYDLSQGMARQMGPALGLHDLEGVWHTGIVIHNMEIFFGGGGIEHCLPGTTMLGQPLEKKLLGNTNIDVDNLTLYLRNIGQSEFNGSRYDLFTHNCNNFSSALAKFLGVQDIPQHILDLPQKVMASPMAALLRPILEQATPDGQGTAFGGPVQGSNTASSSEHFPPKEFSVISTPMDIDKVMTKLLEFNDKNSSKFAITDDHLTRLRLLNEPGVKLDREVSMTLESFLSTNFLMVVFHLQILDDVFSPVLNSWPNDDTFPLLHIICANVGREGLTKDLSTRLYKLIKTNKMLKASDSPQTRMCLRLLVSYFSNESSRDVIIENREELFGDVNCLIEECGELSPQVST
jgi:hypothetical protein